MDAVDFLNHESPPIQARKHERTIPASNQLLHPADGTEDKEFHIFMSDVLSKRCRSDADIFHYVSSLAKNVLSPHRSYKDRMKFNYSSGHLGVEQLWRLLKAKGYNIVRRDRASGGGGLVFLIRDVNFQRLPDIGNDTSDVEYLGTAVHSKYRTITIKNLYHPPNSQHLDTNMMEGLFDDNTIILGDSIAKNTTWGSTITNARGLELSNLVNDKAVLCLNDGTHTFRSSSYDLAFISPGLFPYSSWTVLDNIGSDYLPTLV
ncbi:RNA-directed DNA polymerase from mobile element jockey [Trichonephila clavipes]|nr:RNA-directed DNA polymerase from mobile element jockey [Trichonephila clavipes]